MRRPKFIANVYSQSDLAITTKALQNTGSPQMKQEAIKLGEANQSMNVSVSSKESVLCACGIKATSIKQHVLDRDNQRFNLKFMEAQLKSNLRTNFSGDFITFECKSVLQNDLHVLVAHRTKADHQKCVLVMLQGSFQPEFSKICSDEYLAHSTRSKLTMQVTPYSILRG